jgi:UDP-N-acetylmuramoyl-tripeptide--D-alanyl-D-alanine ligase
MATIQLTNSEIATCLNLPVNSANKNFLHITSDSRQVRRGSLFVALVGEQQDGHQYIEKALEKGALGVVHRKGFTAKFGEASSFPVEDTLSAYRALANLWRRKFTIPVIAICGSAGKTTTKEFTAALLRGKWKNVLQTVASQNGFTGIPATLLNLKAEHEAAVIEVGIDEPNSMEQHLGIVEPTGGILTSIGAEHLEKRIDLNTVAKEEGKLFQYLDKPSHFICVNCDDPLIVEAANIVKKAKKFLYGLHTNARIENKDLVLTQTNTRLPLPLAGVHNAQNLLGAVAIAQALGLGPEEMARGLASFQAPEGRSQVYTWRGATIYFDAYNANPISVEAALKLLEKKYHRNWVCLGDMLELGAQEEQLHRNLAKPILEAKPDYVCLFGERMRWLADELTQKKIAAKVRHFDNPAEMAEAIAKGVAEKDQVLIKGSRGMKMERVWEALQKS